MQKAMKKLTLILGIAFALVLMLAIETALMGSVIYFAGIRTSDEPTDLSGLPYLLGALAVIAFVFWLSRGATPTGAPIDMTPKVIKLGYSRHDCADVIMYAAAVADARQTGRQLGAPVELVTPPGFSTDRLDADTLDNWQWLKAHPDLGVTITKG